MAKSRKPYPGMGLYVLALDYNGTWVAYGGAMTEAGAVALRRRLPQWPDEKVKIVHNVPPA